MAFLSRTAEKSLKKDLGRQVSSLGWAASRSGDRTGSWKPRSACTICVTSTAGNLIGKPPH